MAVTANHFQISKTARVNASLHGEMMTLVIIALVVVSVLYFAWDENICREGHQERVY
jgi:hypothetical protein